MSSNPILKPYLGVAYGTQQCLVSAIFISRNCIPDKPRKQSIIPGIVCGELSGGYHLCLEQGRRMISLAHSCIWIFGSIISYPRESQPFTKDPRHYPQEIDLQASPTEDILRARQCTRVYTVVYTWVYSCVHTCILIPPRQEVYAGDLYTQDTDTSIFGVCSLTTSHYGDFMRQP